MRVVFANPYTLLLILTIITIWHYEKSVKLEYIKFPFSLDGAVVDTDAINIPLRTNPRAGIYYEINGVKKSTLADYEGYASIYHFFDTDKLEVSIYEDKYQTKIKTITIYRGESDTGFNPRKVFDTPYYEIAKNTQMNYFVEDDYILIDIKTPDGFPTEAMAYVRYLIDEFSFKVDLLKEENNIYQTIYRVNDRVVNV